MRILIKFGLEVCDFPPFLSSCLLINVVMGYTSDYMPYVGDVPDKPGQFIVAGFTGHGMPLILLSAKGIAEMIRGEKSFEQTDLPRLFKPSKERLESEKNEILCVKPLESGNRIYKL